MVHQQNRKRVNVQSRYFWLDYRGQLVRHRKALGIHRLCLWDLFTSIHRDRRRSGLFHVKFLTVHLVIWVMKAGRHADERFQAFALIYTIHQLRIIFFLNSLIILSEKLITHFCLVKNSEISTFLFFILFSRDVFPTMWKAAPDLNPKKAENNYFN